MFDNTSAPNLENTSDRWIGKGKSFFSSFSISYSGKYVSFSIEPFYFYNQNKYYPNPLRVGLFSKLNDNRPHKNNPYKLSDFRESQFYLHYKGMGVGFSNTNMWWGPGIHSSLNMTNNAPGFKHFMFGTLREQRIKNIGIDVRYIFSEMDSLNTSEPYYTALVLSITLYSDPVVTVGLSRTYLTGGNRTDETITKKDAMLIPFEGLFLESKQTDPDDPTSSLDVWDQTLSGYLCASFPKSGLKIFLELGRNDHAWGEADFRRQPDHSMASVLGFRKYGLFGFQNITAGIEYVNIIKDRFWTKRVPGNWYDRWQYDYSSYDGRHWGAHSGPDSDDFTVYLGYLGNRFSFIPSFNYERHGVIDNPELVWARRPVLVKDPETGKRVPKLVEFLMEKDNNIFPEVKFEFRLDVRWTFKNLRFNLYYEQEYVDNYEFKGNEREGEVVWLGVERRFENLKLPKIF